ncbi:hypothetical protein MMC15_006883 [Xylographa vitiligo]|nr:hypothetical protein [Xylographa vitiligo]
MAPKEAIAALDAGDAVDCEKIVQKRMLIDTNLRWTMTHGIWEFKALNISDFITRTAQFSIEGIVEQIQCPCLVLEAESDMFFQGQPQKVYDALRAPKKLLKFTKEDGAENHCQSGAL